MNKSKHQRKFANIFSKLAVATLGLTGFCAVVLRDIYILGLVLVGIIIAAFLLFVALVLEQQ
jgi:hypothetical protein